MKSYSFFIPIKNHSHIVTYLFIGILCGFFSSCNIEQKGMLSGNNTEQKGVLSNNSDIKNLVTGYTRQMCKIPNISNKITFIISQLYGMNWTCSVCTFFNNKENMKCQICGKTNSIIDNSGWNCSKCTFFNKNENMKCQICGKTNSIIDNSGWSCSKCTFFNKNENIKCQICNSNKTLSTKNKKDNNKNKQQINNNSNVKKQNINTNSTKILNIVSINTYISKYNNPDYWVCSECLHFNGNSEGKHKRNIRIRRDSRNPTGSRDPNVSAYNTHILDMYDNQGCCEKCKIEYDVAGRTPCIILYKHVCTNCHHVYQTGKVTNCPKCNIEKYKKN